MKMAKKNMYMCVIYSSVIVYGIGQLKSYILCFLVDIYGIWFYDKDECARIGQMMNRYVPSQRSFGRRRSSISQLFCFVSLAACRNGLRRSSPGRRFRAIVKGELRRAIHFLRTRLRSEKTVTSYLFSPRPYTNTTK